MAWWEGQRQAVLMLPSGKNCKAQHPLPAECVMTIHCDGAAAEKPSGVVFTRRGALH